MSFKNTKKTFLKKIFPWIGFSLIATSGLVGIGFGISNFINYGSNNKGTGYSNTLKTTLQFALSSNDDVQDLNTAEDIGQKISLLMSDVNANEVQIQSGISKNNSVLGTGSISTIGNVYVYTEQNLYDFDFDFSFLDDPEITDPREIANKKAMIDVERFNLYYTLTQTNTYQLANFGFSLNQTSSNQNNFLNIYRFNNPSDAMQSSKAILSDKERMLFDLRLPNTPITNNELRWDLSSFQKQFTDVYTWDGSDETTRSEVISNSSLTDDNRPRPENSYVLWKNRNGLINLLQNLTTISFLNRNAESVFQNDVDKMLRVQNLYSQVSGNEEYKKYMEWSSSYNYSLIMRDLFAALNNDFGLSLNENTDPLLSLLNTYYIATSSNTTRNEYEFLYSWRFASNSLLSGYLQPIDYNNWFNFFNEDATDEQLKDPNYVKENYLSNSFDVNWSVSTWGPKNIQLAVNYANNAAISQPFINYPLLEIVNNNQFNNEQAVYNQFFTNFLDKTVTLLSSTISNPIVGNNAFNSVLIGISVIILLIAIIVSVLYKIPGLLLGFCSLVSFCLSLLIISNLSITFTMNTIFTFIGLLAIGFIPFVIASKKMHDAIWIKKFNIRNSYKEFMASFIRSSLIADLTAIIISLVMMFFGQFQIRSFGSTMTIVALATMLCNFVVFMILNSIMFVMTMREKPLLMLSNSDFNALLSIKNVTSFDQHILRNEKSKKQSIVDVSIVKIFSAKNWVWILLGSILTLMVVVGIVLFAIFGMKTSFVFQYSNQITISFNSSELATAQAIVQELAEKLSITWTSSVVVVDEINGIYQMILVPSQLLSPTTLYEMINTLNNASNWIDKVQFASNDPYFANLLLKNLVICLLISLGFLAIFNLFAFNFINVIPIFIISIIANLVMLFTIVLIQISVNLNIIEAYLAAFTFSQIMLVLIYSQIKSSFIKSEHYTFKQLNSLSIAQIQENFKIILIFTGSYILVNLIMMLFDTRTNATNYGVNVIVIIFGLVMTLITTPIVFSCFMFIREWYLSKVMVDRLENRNSLYDKVDEQIIAGINKR